MFCRRKIEDIDNSLLLSPKRKDSKKIEVISLISSDEDSENESGKPIIRKTNSTTVKTSNEGNASTVSCSLASSQETLNTVSTVEPATQPFTIPGTETRRNPEIGNEPDSSHDLDGDGGSDSSDIPLFDLTT